MILKCGATGKSMNKTSKNMMFNMEISDQHKIKSD